MKIVHIAPNAPYNEGWSYQENYLPRFQAQLGHEVLLIITNQEHKEGCIQETECIDYFSADGFRVIRLKQVRVKCPVISRVLGKLNVYEILERERPDFVFYHGLLSATIFQVCRYKKIENPNCVIVQDNHLDQNIGFGIPVTLRQKCVRLIYRTIFKLTKKDIAKVYGVTPWRQQYAQEYFHVPPEMTDVLIMGAADEKIHFSQHEALRREIRTVNQIQKDDFLIVSGGKIDEKKKIHLLMEAVNRLQGVKLIVFGNVLEDVEEEFEQQLSEKVKWVGFIPSDKAYDYFLAADLIVFPGQHSVLWEQACACKIPCLFARWEGMEHVDNGGNSDFIDDVTVETLIKKILELKFTAKYEQMKITAASEKTDVYLYSKIAEKSLECAERCH